MHFQFTALLIILMCWHGTTFGNSLHKASTKTNRGSHDEINSDWNLRPQNDCHLKVAEKSVLSFYNGILYNKTNALTLRLTFSRFNNGFNVTAKPGIILPYHWMWVYGQTLPILNMPPSASIWSLGLLAFYYAKIPMEIEIEPENTTSCMGAEFEIGDPLTDQMIGKALGDMMRGLAMKYLQYNTSHWCYMNKTRGSDSELLRAIDNNFASVSPTVQFVCCSYDLARDFNMNVTCQHVHVYDSIWWDVPLGLGILMWLYFPLLFMKVNGKIHKLILKSSETNEEEDANSVDGKVNETVINKDNDNEQSNVFNNGKSPITAFSMIKHPLSRLLPRKQKNKSRIAIFVYTILTLLIPGIQILVLSIFRYDYIKSLADSNITFGFSSVLAGWDKFTHIKLSILGGPIIAVCLYLVVGWILLLSPKLLAHQVYRGVCDSSEPTKSILCVSLKKKEELGSTTIRNVTNGYYRLMKLQICHIFMLINPDYWILTLLLVKKRYCWFASALKSHLPLTILRLIIICVWFPFYAVFCLVEVIFGLIYFSCPMFSFFFCVTVGLCLGVKKYVSVKILPRSPRLGLIVRYSACLVVCLMFIFYLYIFTVLFIDSFFCVSKTLLFTYTAVVAYPRETYGYFMLVLLSAYFGLKGFFQFGDMYRMILKLTIKLCKQDELLKTSVVLHIDQDGRETYGISREMFEFVVERIRPRRVHILYTVLRFVIMVFILSISIVLIVRFEKFDDISLLVHVFITIFICALPSIYQSMISKGNTKLRMTRKIKKHLKHWTLIKMTSIQTHTAQHE